MGNPNEITVKEVVEKIINLTESKSKLIYLDLQKMIPQIENQIFLEL